jgi:hypothetical protein
METYLDGLARDFRCAFRNSAKIIVSPSSPPSPWLSVSALLWSSSALSTASSSTHFRTEASTGRWLLE